MSRELMHIDEVATMLRVPLETLRRWRRAGDGPPMFKIGRRVMAYRDAVEDWVEQQSRDAQGA